MKKTLPLALAAITVASAAIHCGAKPDDTNLTNASADSLRLADSLRIADSIAEAQRYARLTDDDFREIADQMGVEVAAIKAVVEIEAGKALKGFWAPGKPIINFDLSMYRKIAPKYGLDLRKVRKMAPAVFASPNKRKYGSQQAAEQAILDAAISVDSAAAMESTFWGMFQIGGFNYKICGFDRVEDFVDQMSQSERAQLELFAVFCDTLGYTRYIRNRDWAGFARRYNGPSYKSRRYDSRMAAAYRRYSKK